MIVLLGWFVLGPFYLIYTNFVDICILINILCMNTSENYEYNEEERIKSDLHKLIIIKDAANALK